jgi:hypothetical protein
MQFNHDEVFYAQTHISSVIPPNRENLTTLAILPLVIAVRCEPDGIAE